jgi:carbon starvation protein CstA
LPFLRGLMGFWYHFAIMFEALFVLTLIDAGTRVTRYMLQEAGSLAVPELRAWKGLAPSVVFSALAVGGWGYFVWTGTVSAVWPLLGVCNQMLAAFALAIGTSALINTGRARYAGVTLGPLVFMVVNTLTAGWLNLSVNYLRPQIETGAPGLWAAFLAAPWPARLQSVVTLAVMALLLIVLCDCLGHWMRAWRRPTSPVLARADAPAAP